MEIRRDIALKGREWNEAINGYKEIFANRTNYQLFVLALSIGIMYDERIKCFEDVDNFSSVPRNVIANNDNGILDYCFQTAILSTKTEELDEKTRLEYAFGEKSNFDKIKFLLEFANFGIKKLLELIDNNLLVTMHNLLEFLSNSVENEIEEIEDILEEV